MFALTRRRFALLVLIAVLPLARAADGEAQSKLIQRILSRDPALLVLDVRTAEEYGLAHVIGARNLPHDQLEESAAARPNALLPTDKSSEIVVYCRSGRRSALAIATLQKLGYSHVEHLEGDFLGWQAANRPVEPAPKAQ